MSLATSIAQAINFLTAPLALIYDPVLINGLQGILRTTIFASVQQAYQMKLIMTFTIATPPRPVQAACFVLGIQWAEWIELLGNREFDILLDAQSVVVRYDGLEDNSPPRTIVLWTAPQLTPAKRSLLAQLSVPQVPISKLGQAASTKFNHRQPAMKQPTMSIFPPSPSKGRTLAQQLLDSDHEEEADELLSMISTSAIISPTPTRERFCLPSLTQTQIRLPFASFSPSPISSPEPCSPESSRPSSRSSTFSTFSISDDESLSSATSVSSSIRQSEPLPSKAPLSRPQIPRRESSEPQVFVDHSKKNTTKYLYQGGVSSTLGGGVMLGRPSAPAAPKPAPTPKYRAPIGGKKIGVNAPSWRRAAYPTPRA